MKKKFKLSMRTRDSFIGLFYLTPFIIGLCVFFLYPVVSSLLLSFGDLDEEKIGFGIVLEGFGNYVKAFRTDTNFLPRLWRSLKSVIINTPLVVIFSLILAIMLSKIKYGKGFYRVVFLLPFVLGTGAVMTMLLKQGVDTQIISISNSSIIPRQWLLYLGADIVEILDMFFSSIIRILWQSSVQLILFLSAILGISPALYESAKIDGANAYETFWKITLPMVSPILLLNTIYTIITSFTESNNEVLTYITDNTIRYAMHGYAAAMGWVYFIAILLIIGFVFVTLGTYARKNQGYGGKR